MLKRVIYSLYQMTPCVILIVCVRLTGRCICIPNTLFMEVTMKHQKDTAVRCVYIALRWSAVASARFSIDILLRWSKETSWHRRAWCVFCRSELCARVFSSINQGSRVKLAPTKRGGLEANKHQHSNRHKVL